MVSVMILLVRFNVAWTVGAKICGLNQCSDRSANTKCYREVMMTRVMINPSNLHVSKLGFPSVKYYIFLLGEPVVGYSLGSWVCNRGQEIETNYCGYKRYSAYNQTQFETRPLTSLKLFKLFDDNSVRANARKCMQVQTNV